MENGTDAANVSGETSQLHALLLQKLFLPKVSVVNESSVRTVGWMLILCRSIYCAEYILYIYFFEIINFFVIVGSEDKMWADVDKDLGELLSEVDAQANEGSDDEEDLGR